MTDKNPISTIQINCADTQNIAAGSHFEVHGGLSVEMFLNTAPQAEIDRATLDNVNLFRERFGTEVATRDGRAQALAIQQCHQFTDREMRRLRHAGLLLIKRNEVRLVPNRMVWATGILYLAFLSLLCGVFIILMALAPNPAWKQMLGEVIMATIWLGGTWGLTTFCIEPWRLLRKVGVVTAR